MKEKILVYINQEVYLYFDFIITTIHFFVIYFKTIKVLFKKLQSNILTVYKKEKQIIYVYFSTCWTQFKKFLLYYINNDTKGKLLHV